MRRVQLRKNRSYSMEDEMENETGTGVLYVPKILELRILRVKDFVHQQ